MLHHTRERLRGVGICVIDRELLDLMIVSLIEILSIKWYTELTNKSDAILYPLPHMTYY
jgi:hypothetical protein